MYEVLVFLKQIGLQLDQMVVKISGLNKRGVNCFHKIFAKFGSRVKSYEKSTN